MKVRIAGIWFAAIAMIAGFIASSAVHFTETPASAATRMLEESGAEVRAHYVSAVGSGSSLVMSVELFRKNGFHTWDGEKDIVYPETVVSRTRLTPNTSGQLVKMESTLSDTGNNLLVRSIRNDTGPVKHSYQASGRTWDQQRPSSERLSNTHLTEWLDAQLDFISTLAERGYTYAGRGALFGRQSVRYERQATISRLPDGSTISPVEIRFVLEFVEDNPLLGQESHYTVLSNGELELDFQNTVTEFTVAPANTQPPEPAP